MRTRRRLIVALSTLLSIAAPTWAAQPPPGAIREPVKVTRTGAALTVTLAPALQRALQKHVPGFALPRLDEFDPEMLTYLRKAHKEPFAPFACTGDFDGNGLPDAALFVRDRKDRWVFVAFHQAPNARFTPYRIHGGGTPMRLLSSDRVAEFIALQPKGRVRYLIPVSDPVNLRPATMSLKHDGILFAWFETASHVYYFAKGKYRCVITGD
jgi:hypothetical protein